MKQRLAISQTLYLDFQISIPQLLIDFSAQGKNQCKCLREQEYRHQMKQVQLLLPDFKIFLDHFALALAAKSSPSKGNVMLRYSQLNLFYPCSLLNDYMRQIDFMIKCNRSTIFVNFSHLQTVRARPITKRETPIIFLDRVILNWLRRYCWNTFDLNPICVMPYPMWWAKTMKVLFLILIEDKGKSILTSLLNWFHLVEFLLLFREFFVALYNLPEHFSIRQLRAQKVGQLVSLKGTVTRTSEVRMFCAYCLLVSY